MNLVDYGMFAIAVSGSLFLLTISVLLAVVVYQDGRDEEDDDS